MLTGRFSGDRFREIRILPFSLASMAGQVFSWGMTVFAERGRLNSLVETPRPGRIVNVADDRTPSAH